VSWLWHGRYGHLNFGALRRPVNAKMVQGLLALDQVDQVSDGCLIGKQRHSSFLGQACHRAKAALNLVHGDLCGEITPSTPSGSNYFLLLVDDMSCYMWVQLLSSKDEALVAIKNFQSSIEVETGRKLKTSCTDRRREFTSIEFRRHYAEHDVKHQLTTP
jgi:hypothetical protein